MKMKKKLIRLGAFIESVKSELLEYQTKHEGEKALFELDEVEITASVVTKWEGEAKATIFAVVGVGAAGKEEGGHKMRVAKGMYPIMPYGRFVEIPTESRPTIPGTESEPT